MNGTAGGQGRDSLLALFDGLYAECQRPVFAYLLGATNDREVAADLVQETFTRAWQHRAELATMAAERRRFWLFHVARNLRTDHYRRQAHADLMPLDEGDAAAPSADTVELADVDAAIRRLPDDLRSVLVMNAVADMTSAEIGEALQRPAGTVRYQLTRARRLLAEDLFGVQGSGRSPGSELG